MNGKTKRKVISEQEKDQFLQNPKIQIFMTFKINDTKTDRIARKR